MTTSNKPEAATSQSEDFPKPLPGASRPAARLEGSSAACQSGGSGAGLKLLSVGPLLPLILLCFACTTSVAGQSSGALAHYDLAAAPAARVELPAELYEISGIASQADSRLLAHSDEVAVIWQLDWPSGRTVKRFGIGGSSGPIRADFEDIQLVGSRIYLVTSTGQIVEAREGADGQTSPALRTSSGLKAGCEVEGMSWDAPSGSMLLLCKSVKSRRWKDHVVVLAVSPETGRFEPKPRLTVPESELERATGVKRFSGTALVRHPRTGTYLMLAGPQRAYAEIDSTGKVLGGGKLSPQRHRQPEGIAIAPDLTLLISDEGAGKKGTITGYAYRR